MMSKSQEKRLTTQMGADKAEKLKRALEYLGMTHEQAYELKTWNGHRLNREWLRITGSSMKTLMKAMGFNPTTCVFGNSRIETMAEVKCLLVEFAKWWNREEGANLQCQVDFLKATNTNWQKMDGELRAEIEELKKENKKLQEGSEKAYSNWAIEKAKAIKAKEEEEKNYLRYAQATAEKHEYKNKYEIAERRKNLWVDLLFLSVAINVAVIGAVIIEFAKG